MKFFCELSDKEFDDFSQSFTPASFLQSLEMAKSQTERGQEIHFYGLKNGNEVIAAGLFTVHPYRKIFKIMTCSGGVLMDYSNLEDLKLLRQGLIDHLGPKGIAQVQILPSFPLIEHDNDGNIVKDGFDNHVLVKNLLEAGFHHHGYHNHYGCNDMRWFFHKDLRALNNSSDLINTFDKHNRRALRKALRFGVSVRDLEYNELDKFVQIMNHTGDRRNFTHQNLDYYQSIYRQFVPQEKARFLIAELDLSDYKKSLLSMRKKEEIEQEKAQKNYNEKSTRKAANRLKAIEDTIQSYDNKLKEIELFRDEGPILSLAVSLFFKHVDSVTYLFSGAYDQYMQFNGPYAIVWEALKWALQSNIPIFDFYGTVGKYAGHEDEGVFQFKKRFGGAVVEKPGTFSVNPNPALHKILKLISNIQ